MPRNSSRRMLTPSHAAPKRMCKNHPNVPAAANSSVCKNCQHYDAEAKKKAATSDHK